MRTYKGLWADRSDETGQWVRIDRVGRLAASIGGTSGVDVIHRLGDGHDAGFGQNDITTVTTGNDVIDAGNGDDFVYADLGNDRATGGNGSDFLFGDDGNDTLTGNNGNDILIGGQGVDAMNGGAGTDLFRYDAASEISGLAESIDGGSDINTIDFRAATGPIDLSAATITGVETLLLTGNDVTLTAAQLGAFTTIGASFGVDRLILSAAGTVDLTGANLDGLIDEFRGSNGADTFVFSDVAAGQRINTLDGNDTVFGTLGNDTIDGGTGADNLSGGDGNDTLTGGVGIDTLAGEVGNDLIIGGSSADRITGGAGNDDIAFQLVGDISGLVERIDGGDDHDNLDFARFGAGGAVDLSNAVITSVEEIDLSGTQVTLTAAQLGAFDTIVASFGLDTLTLANAGTADLTGATISDLLDGIYGSSGDDTIIFTGVSSGLRLVDGGGGADTLTGGGGFDTLIGGDGTDTVSGGAGNDTIRGGQDADTLSGGVGNDIFLFAGVSDISGLAETIDGGNDVDTIDFATLGAFGAIDLTAATISRVETLVLGNNEVTLTAAQLGAFTTIQAGFGVERLILSAPGVADLSGADLSGLIDEIRGSSGADQIDLTNVANGQTVNGMAGADRLTGSEGGDTLNGGDANDTLLGRGGSDVLTGGAAADSLTGGTGADIFRYNHVTDSAGRANDTIRDFTHGQDVIDLGAIDANSEVQGNQTFAFIGNAAFGNIAGELRYAAGTILGDVDGDGSADFSITLTGNPTITASDLIL